MARLPFIREDDPNADADAVGLLRELEGTFGSVINLQRVMVHNPEVTRAFFNMMRTLYLESRLTPKQTELPYLTSTMTLQCHY